jgi:hypothetical protein
MSAVAPAEAGPQRAKDAEPITDGIPAIAGMTGQAGGEVSAASFARLRSVNQMAISASS